MSLRNERLDYALSLAQKAIKLNPDEAIYEDTYAWIFYVKGDVEQAKIWIEKAIKHGGDNDPDILEHYGDILFKSGDNEKAKLYWEKAKDKGNTNPELLQKIQSTIN